MTYRNTVIALAAVLAFVIVGLLIALLLLPSPHTPSDTATSTDSGDMPLPADTSGLSLYSAHVAAPITLTDGSVVTVTAIKNDSRCPADVQCIQAGTVTVTLTVKTASGTTTQDLALNTPATFAGYTAELIRVDPAKNSKATLKPSDYVLTFTFQSVPEH